MIVAPAQAGAQSVPASAGTTNWVPAFAGTTIHRARYPHD